MKDFENALLLIEASAEKSAAASTLSPLSGEEFSGRFDDVLHLCSEHSYRLWNHYLKQLPEVIKNI